MIKRLMAASMMSALCATAAIAEAPTFVRVIVPYAPGGSVDLLARLLGDEIGKAGGPSVLVEDKPGASTIIGTEAVARATPDGSTVGMVANSFLINAAIRKLSYDPLTSFEPICHLVDSPQVVAVNANSPYKTLDDLLADARKRPGVLTMGALGPATTQHVAVEIFKKYAKADLTFVPYPGGAPAVNAIVGEQVTSTVANYSELQPFIVAGKLRPLAVMTAQRLSSLPDVPTVKEKGLDFEITAWFAMVATGKTPKPVVASLIKYFSDALARPATREKLTQLQLTPVGLCGDGFADFLRKQNETIAPVVRAAGIKLE
jgi:tripartite-type tricarboxylate transporter receptor subunit TctC